MRLRPRSALLIFLALTILHTWPLASAPGRLALNHTDAQHLEWMFSWYARTIVRDPIHLFDGNIFAPERHVLAYADPVIVPALLGAPVRWLGGSPVLTFNLVLIAGLALTAWAGWFVAWKWTGSTDAALVAGALTAFNAHLLTRLAHVQAGHSWGLPLALYFADQMLDRPRRADVMGLALVVAATAATSAYSLAFVGLIVGVTMIFGLRRWRSVAAIGGASLLGLVLALPVLWPYVEMARAGESRPLEMVAQFSATPAGYLTSLSRLDAGWSAPFLRDDVNVLFAGVVALALATLGVISNWTNDRARRRLLLLAAIAAAGVLLSFGPATGVYRWLYAWVPPLRGLRAVARFGYLYLIAVAIAAGFGVAAINRRIGSERARIAIVVLCLFAVTAEAWSGPIPTVPFKRVPPIYDLLANSSTPVMLVELPFYPADALAMNGEYVLNATAHWQPVMNGYSGFIPDSYRRRADSFWFFPEDWAIDAIEKEGATHVMVHLEKFTQGEVAAIELALRHRPDLRLIGSDSQGHRLYKVARAP